MALGYWPFVSVNHSAPSGPAVIRLGWLLGVGMLHSLITPAVVMRPMLLPFVSVNHSAPSGPAVIPSGSYWLSIGVLRDCSSGGNASDLATEKVCFSKPQRAVTSCRDRNPLESSQHIPCRLTIAFRVLNLD